MKKLNSEELNAVVGGADNYATEVLTKIIDRFQKLIDDGMSPDAAREQAKNEYWSDLLDVCRNNPEPNGCSAEQQAWVLFSLTVGM